MGKTAFPHLAKYTKLYVRVSEIHYVAKKPAREKTVFQTKGGSMNYYERQARNIHKDGFNKCMKLLETRKNAVEKLQNPYANVELVEGCWAEVNAQLNKDFDAMKTLILEGKGL